MATSPNPAQSASAESDVMVACLYCPAGAVYAPEVGPGDEWFYIPETGWACPAHAAAGARSALEVADERHHALQSRCLSAEAARDVHAKHLPMLRDSLRRIVYIHDGALGLEDISDTLAREARRALKAVGARV